MFAIARHVTRFHRVPLRWSSALAGVLAAWLIAYGLTQAWTTLHAHEPSPGSDLARDPTPRFMRAIAEASPLPSTPAASSTPPAAASPYFRTMRRLYGVSAASEPMPPDEMARFHALEPGLPIALARITSHFGERRDPFGKGHVFHRGIDMAAPTGTPVQAVAGGTVVRAGTDHAYGKFVVIDHHNGYRTLYAHGSKLLVKTGERVQAGQLIARVGSTGRSTAPHLHFEIHRDGRRVDPYPYLVTL